MPLQLCRCADNGYIRLLFWCCRPILPLPLQYSRGKPVLYVHRYADRRRPAFWVDPFAVHDYPLQSLYRKFHIFEPYLYPTLKINIRGIPAKYYFQKSRNLRIVRCTVSNYHKSVKTLALYHVHKAANNFFGYFLLSRRRQLAVFP